MAIAQFNIAYARWPLDDPRMAGFTDNVVRMNALAERHPGFIWRVGSDKAKELIDGGPRMTWTLSLWQSPEALADFAFRTAHRRFFRARADWFEKLAEAPIVFWETDAAARPELAEARARKARFDREGPGDWGFGWERFADLAALRAAADGTGSTALAARASVPA